MKNILVTGGQGLIGSEICKKYNEEGWNVFVWDNKSNKYNDYSCCFGEDLFNIYKGNLKQAFEKIKFDVISHQASLVSVGESQFKIQKYMDNNVSITSELLQCILDTNNIPDKIFFASSMGIYGNVLTESNDYISEDYEKKPCSFYGVSKLCQEEMLRVFSETYNVPVFALRYFSVYGNINPLNPLTGVVSMIVNKFLNSDIVELNEDGQQTRDFIHSEEIAKIHYMLNCNFKGKQVFNCFNVGSGLSFTLEEIAEYIKTKLNSDKKIVFNNKYRKGDIRFSEANISKLKEQGWKQLKVFTDEIDKYLEFVLNNKNLFVSSKDTCKEADRELIKRGLL